MAGTAATPYTPRNWTFVFLAVLSLVISAFGLAFLIQGYNALSKNLTLVTRAAEIVQSGADETGDSSDFCLTSGSSTICSGGNYRIRLKGTNQYLLAGLGLDPSLAGFASLNSDTSQWRVVLRNLDSGFWSFYSASTVQAGRILSYPTIDSTDTTTVSWQIGMNLTGGQNFKIAGASANDGSFVISDGVLSQVIELQSYATNEEVLVVPKSLACVYRKCTSSDSRNHASCL